MVLPSNDNSLGVKVASGQCCHAHSLDLFNRKVVLSGNWKFVSVWCGMCEGEPCTHASVICSINNVLLFIWASNQ